MKFEVAPAELDILCEDLDLGRFIEPYEIPYIGESGTKRAAHREKVHQRLRRDGWYTRNGNLRGDIEDLLEAWAWPDVAFTHVVNAHEHGGKFLFRGSWRGRTGCYTDLKGDTLAFKELHPAAVIDEMVGVLPNWKPIHGQVRSFITGEQSTPRRTEPDVDEEFFGGIDAPAAPPSREPRGPRGLEAFLSAPVLRTGIITCSTREPDTRIRRGRLAPAGSLTWVDTINGRFFRTTEHLSDGARRHTVVPADRARIAQWLRDLLNRARDY